MTIRGLIIAVIALLMIAPAAAQERSLHWERYDVDVQVSPGGELRVKEQQEIVVDEGTFRSGTRAIELVFGEEVRDVAVSEGGRPYQKTSAGDETPGTYQVSEGDGSVQIKYWFADTAAREHPMLITYTVLGALARQGSDEARLSWQFYAGSPAPIEAGEVRVTLPGRPAATDISYSNSGGIGTGGRLQGSTVVYSVSNVRPGQQSLEAEVTFPRSILQAGVDLRAPAVREQPRNSNPPSEREPASRQPGGAPVPQPSEGSGMMSLICCLVLFFVMFSVITSFFRRAARGVMGSGQTGMGGYPPGGGYQQGGWGYPRRRSGLGGLGALLPWILMRPRSGYNDSPPHNSPYNPGPFGDGGSQGGDGFSGGSWGDSGSSSDGFSGGSWGDSGSSGGFSGGSWGDSGGSSGGSSDSSGGGSSSFD